MVAQFDVPLNLPHAGKITDRLLHVLDRIIRAQPEPPRHVIKLARELFDLLQPCLTAGMNPPPDEAEPLREQAAQIGRSLVDEIERHALGEDRLGECIRNLFECLELGEEGAILSLRAGENPDSLQRPMVQRAR